MKNIFTLITLFASSFTFAQEIEDQISMDANYTNDIYYSLKNGEVASVGGSNWTVAFYNKSQSAAIMINEARGVELWNASENIADFASITDTIGLSTFTKLHDVDTTWDEFSAFEGEALGSQSNYGWGEYNFSNHKVTASRIFILKTINGTFYKVMVVDKVNSVFKYRYASLDNSFDTTITVVVPDYLNQSYAYLNMDNHTTLERDPKTENWDFLFTKYQTDYQGLQYYPVTGVVSREGVLIAEVEELPSTATYSGKTYRGAKNVIGSDWKTFDQANGVYTLKDTLTYFVQTLEGEIYKLYFTEFEGGATGNITFKKELVGQITTGIKENITSIQFNNIYPNPTQGKAELVFHTDKNKSIDIKVYSLIGQLAYQNKFEAKSGLNAVSINLNNVENGIYLVQLNDGKSTSTQKLVINK